jgi:hypothetical protein
MKYPSEESIKRLGYNSLTDYLSEIVHDGFARGELLAAFNMVEDKQNWKNPIDAEVTFLFGEEEYTKNVTKAAIVFYTGSVPTFELINNNTLRVKAIGYYGAGC